jgi:hypothetical protein
VRAVGFLDRLKGATRGVLSAAKPKPGTAPAPAEEVKRRLLAITGKGVQPGEDDEGRVVISWAAEVASSGVGGAESEYLYRAIRVELDPAKATASASS